MLLPLEFSMNLWWVSTPEWGTEPEPEPAVDLATALGLLSLAIDLPAPEPTDAPASASLDDAALEAPAPPLPVALPLPAPPRAPRPPVVTGYHWTAEFDWMPCRGILWDGAQHARRNDAERRRDDRFGAPLLRAIEP